MTAADQNADINRRAAVIFAAIDDYEEGEFLAGGSDHLDDALTCVAALCLASLGRDREGLSMVVVALARHLPRYNRSMANYGKALLED
jgi:hypothetical protein